MVTSAGHNHHAGAEAEASRARRNRAFKQLLKRNIEVIGQPPQIRQQVRAGDHAHIQLAGQRHHGDVQPAPVKQRSERIHRLDFTGKKYSVACGPGRFETMRLCTGFPISGESARRRKTAPSTARAANCADRQHFSIN